MKLFIKCFIFTIIAGLFVGLGLAYMQRDYHLNSTIEVMDQYDSHYISNATVFTFPNLPQAFDANMSGPGRYIFKIDDWSPELIVVRAKSYHFKLLITILKPDDVRDVYLNKK
jgi:hypothetical protein